MATPTTSSTRARSAHYLKIKEGKFIELQLKTVAFSNTGLRSALGISPTAPTDATQIVGVGKDDAFQNGAVPVVLYYEVANGRRQSARVMCSPEKADTVFADARGQQYNGKTIKKVGFPRRRSYVY